MVLLVINKARVEPQHDLRMSPPSGRIWQRSHDGLSLSHQCLVRFATASIYKNKNSERTWLQKSIMHLTENVQKSDFTLLRQTLQTVSVQRETSNETIYNRMWGVSSCCLHNKALKGNGFWRNDAGITSGSRNKTKAKKKENTGGNLELRQS